jgi:hypothetical protein
MLSITMVSIGYLRLSSFKPRLSRASKIEIALAEPASLAVL